MPRARSIVITFWIGWWLTCGASFGQPIGQAGPRTAPVVETDALGRATPRGAVLGFLRNARQKRYAVAAEYLNIQQRGRDASRLAEELSIVLDRRLAADLNRLSDEPDGSLAIPSKLREELIGTIQTESGDVDILLERVSRGQAGQIWLFSRKTLESIPAVHAELILEPIENGLPSFLVETRIAGVALFQWLALFVGLPLFFYLLVLLNRILGWLAGALRRRVRGDSALANPDILRGPIRLLLLVVAIRWALSVWTLPLLARQFWANAASILLIATGVWLGFALSGWAETYIRHHLMRRDRAGLASILTLARWGVNLLLLIGGALVALHHFGINPNTTLAGLGIGGVAVALGAQKTLENLVAGVSVIFDQAFRVGDLIKVGETSGFVQDVGLRSTRILTFDRTIVSVPNGQLATVTLENFSRRDRFWFHHVLRLDPGTTASQLRAILEGVSALLAGHPSLIRDPLRVHFKGVGPSSLEINIFCYLAARNWDDFLRLQQDLLLKTIEIIECADARLRAPQPSLYLAFPPRDDAADESHAQAPQPGSPRRRRGAA